MTELADVPDGIDVVRTAAEATTLPRPPLLVVEPLRHYLKAHGFGGDTLAWRRIGDGQANITFELRVGDDRIVLRRGPRPPFPPSAHDMLRESRVVHAVGAAGMPVPDVLAVCDDPAVLGVPFYLMPFIEGEVITDTLPASFAPAIVGALGVGNTGARIVDAAVDALADLHAIPLDGEVAALGRPAGYLERQVRRFTQLWPMNTRRSVPGVEAIARELAATVPESARTAVVHGDYRLGNIMFAAPDRIAAVLDWEMATLGDPLADLGYLVATYTERGAARNPMDLTPVTAEPGFPSRRDLVARYTERTGADVSALPWYEALALWKSAVFCEAMYTRWRDGQRPGDTFAPALAEGVPALARAAGDALARLPRRAH